LTQTQLAALAGVGIRFVRELERGKVSYRLGLALTVLQILGLSFSAQDQDNAFGLLGVVGGECAGALSLLPQGSEPPDCARAGTQQPLADARLSEILALL